MVITCWQLWIAIWPLLAILMNCSSDLIGKATAADHLRPFRWQPGCSVISSHCFRLRYKTTDCLAKSLYDAYTVIQGAGRPILSLNTTLILFRKPKMARRSNIASWLWEICWKKKGWTIGFENFVKNWPNIVLGFSLCFGELFFSPLFFGWLCPKKSKDGKQGLSKVTKEMKILRKKIEYQEGSI